MVMVSIVILSLGSNNISNSLLVGGPNSECKINDSKLKERNRIIKKYVGDEVKLQGEALVAVQFLIHRY